MSLLDVLSAQLGGDAATRLAGVLGADPGPTGRAISAALPTLLAGLADNAARPGGADALAAALDRHDGSALDRAAAGEVDAIDTADGEKILGHVLGERRGAVETRLAQQSGLDLGSITKLLPILAPIVMGMLGRKKASEGLGADGIGSILAGERSGLAGTLGKLLDRDGDGNPLDDLLGMVTGAAGAGAGGASAGAGRASTGGRGGLLGSILGGILKRR